MLENLTTESRSSRTGSRTSSFRNSLLVFQMWKACLIEKCWMISACIAITSERHGKKEGKRYNQLWVKIPT